MIALYDADDRPWIATVVDEIVRGAGGPWRQVLDELDRLPLASSRISAIVAATRRATGGRLRSAAAARRARAATLGAPALDREARSQRIAAAAQVLEVPVEVLEQLLWSDLAKERAVVLPSGRPDELALAAFANEHAIRRMLARAYDVTIRVWGHSGGVIGAAAARGLIAAITRGDAGETVLEVSGPLALLHQTTVYGRALGGLVPYLAACEQFMLAMRCNLRRGETAIEIASPILLPVGPARASWPLVDRLARDLERAGREVERSPAPLAAGRHVACPDLRVGTTYVEVVGFWTEPYLATKLGRYRDAGADVVFCLDTARTRADDALPAGVRALAFERKIPAAQLLELIDLSPHRPSAVLRARRSSGLR